VALVFITGSTDGLGRAAAQWLIRDGHEVVLHARSAERVGALADLAGHSAGTVIGDLRCGAETRNLAEQVNAIGRMDAVIHNAGIYSEPSRNPTPEGHAGILAVNTLAPYILTALITRPARLVYLSSGLHRGGEGSLRDIDWTTRRWDTGRAYAETKLQVAALAFALARRWPDTLCNAVDPGWVHTKMGGSHAPVDLDTGQRTQTWLAVSEEPSAKVTGNYWHDLRQEVPAAEVTDIAVQDALIERLEWLTGVTLP
jgi:NAD(P)-dependent dehydrogenase (short-subunit alcohol dehydrogenase family)